jgi:Rps23 Pro-64 3,4-dihydroxylase Tpa1-like proline 4-hydroxylase
MGKIKTILESIKIEEIREEFLNSGPFNHLIIDNFLPLPLAEKIASEFPKFDESFWYTYDNPLEIKKASNDWNRFSEWTYSYFSKLISDQYLDIFSEISNCKLYPDPGLHGGGLHSHKNGGRLNPHLDYSIHPKMGLQRKLNLILYINPLWKSEYGGQLGFWDSNPDGTHKNLVKEIDCIFNRAVIFDTTQNSWHGISRDVSSPEGVNRNSLAVYYLCEKPDNVDPRMKVKYAPREDQKNDEYISELIEKRQSMEAFDKTYITKIK